MEYEESVKDGEGEQNLDENNGQEKPLEDMKEYSDVNFASASAFIIFSPSDTVQESNIKSTINCILPEHLNVKYVNTESIKTYEKLSLWIETKCPTLSEVR